jgi:hypothetical protein
MLRCCGRLRLTRPRRSLGRSTHGMSAISLEPAMSTDIASKLKQVLLVCFGQGRSTVNCVRSNYSQACCEAAILQVVTTSSKDRTKTYFTEVDRTTAIRVGFGVSTTPCNTSETRNTAAYPAIHPFLLHFNESSFYRTNILTSRWPRCTLGRPLVQIDCRAAAWRGLAALVCSL